MRAMTDPRAADLIVKEMDWGGRGVFTARPFERGEIVLRFGGPRTTRDAIDDFTHHLELGRGWFLGPTGELDDLVNHSCQPNTAVESWARGARLRAVRRIPSHREITYDYSTTMLEDPTTFACHCGSRKCRETVAGWTRLPGCVRDAYIRRRMVPEFILRYERQHDA